MSAVKISARVRDGGSWGDCEFSARSLESGIRTAAKKLGLRGPICGRTIVGTSQYEVNVDGVIMMVIESVAESPQPSPSKWRSTKNANRHRVSLSWTISRELAEEISTRVPVRQRSQFVEAAIREALSKLP